MSLPYLPKVQAELPAQRILLFAREEPFGDAVHRFNEMVRNEAGTSFTAYLITPSLNKEDTLKEYTLNRLHLIYTAEEATSVKVSVSGDGGNTWAEEKEVSVYECGPETRRAAVAFNTTGFDLRVKFSFETEILVKIVAWIPRIVPRGRLGHE